MSSRTDPRLIDRAQNDESRLLALARAGDRDAFDRLAVRLLPRLLGTAQRLLRDGVEAEEVVASALSRVHASLAGFREAAALSTWAHRILCRLAADRVRVLARQRQRERPLPDDLGTRAEAPEPQEVASRLEQAKRLRLLVDLLPTTQRLVLVLVAWEGLTLRQAADLLAMRYATVKSNMHHARLALRDALERLEDGR